MTLNNNKMKPSAKFSNIEKTFRMLFIADSLQTSFISDPEYPSVCLIYITVRIFKILNLKL